MIVKIIKLAHERISDYKDGFKYTNQNAAQKLRGGRQERFMEGRISTTKTTSTDSGKIK